MTELSAEAQAVVDLAEYIAGTEFQNCLAALQGFRQNLPECPTRDHVWGATICLSNLAVRAPDEEAIFNPVEAEVVEEPTPPVE